MTRNDVLGNMPRLISLAILVTLIVVLGMTFFKVLAPFLMPMFLAAMTAVVAQPIFRYFLDQYPGKAAIAAGLTTGALLAAILIPLVTATTLASLQLYSFAADANSDTFRGFLHQVVDLINRFRPEDAPLTVDEVAKQVSAWVKTSLTAMGDKSIGSMAGTTLGALGGILGFLVSMSIGVVIYGMALFYFLAEGPQLLKTAKALIPVEMAYQEELIAEFAKVVQGVVVATFMAALGQGLATMLALWFFGFPHLFALGALATFAALIPLMGTWIVWVPCAAWLFTHQRVTEGVILSAYCILFVGFLDNIIRTYVLNTNVKLHPLLAFISVLGGIQALGLWGVFIGPIIASCLYALIKIFNTELERLSLAQQDDFETKPAASLPPPVTPPPPTATPAS